MARGRRAIRRTNKPIPSTKCCFRVLGFNFVSNGLLCMCVVGGATSEFESSDSEFYKTPYGEYLLRHNTEADEKAEQRSIDALISSTIPKACRRSARTRK